MGNFGKFLGGILGVGAAGALAYEVFQDKVEVPKTRMPATSGTKQGFIAAMKGAIGNLVPDAGLKLAIAWAAFESNWGRCTAYVQGNNPWNITAGSKWTGATVPGKDTEVDANGNTKNITQDWRKYASLAAGVLDWLGFLDGTASASPQNSHYMAALPKLMNGDVSFTDDLRAGGYYTLQADKYKAGVLASLDDVNANWPSA